jgi:acetyl-CoA carboxylase biotin carboxyl carrier protein
MRKHNKEAVVAADKSNRTPHPFEVATVEKLIGLMAEHDLSEIDLHDGDSRIRLRRGHGTFIGTMAAPMPTQISATAPVTPSAQAAQAPGLPETKKHHQITSPTPGTFYAKPSPEDPDYVKVGMKVTPDTVVCKIEAMKIFNDITADCSGTIVEIMVANAQPVEYGQPLFKVQIG